MKILQKVFKKYKIINNEKAKQTKTLYYMPTLNAEFCYCISLIKFLPSTSKQLSPFRFELNIYNFKTWENTNS